MENNFKWLNLQLFAEGDGGGEGAATSGENATATQTADPGQRLRELGVPEDKIRRRARYAAKPATGADTAATASEAENTNEKDAASDTPTEEKQATASPTRMSWDEIMADPEYNKQMQAVVQSRLKSAKGAEETLGKLTPALELLARKHGLDPANMDYDALTKAISDDDSYYEDKALEMGTSLENAKKIDQQERENARRKREEARTIQEQRIQEHFTKLEQQGEALKKVFPSFDLRTELRNPAFARMTSPNVGISVEDAYYVVHRSEIQTAAMQVTAQKTAQKLSNAIQAGSNRPIENGTAGRAPSVTTFDYRNASPAQRAAFKQSLRDKWARGEKVYPGR